MMGTLARGRPLLLHLKVTRGAVAATLGACLICTVLLPEALGAVDRNGGAAGAAPPRTQRIVDEYWTFKDGAPQAVRAFAQTSDGYLWMGAPAGLFRFDGIRFELFRSSFGDQLQSTYPSALFAPAKGGLWVGYLFGGFSFIRNGRVTNFPAITGTVRGFAEDKHGVIWAATSTARGGLWRFDGSSWQQIGAEWGIPPSPVSEAGFDRQGILWVLCGFGPKQLFYLPPGDSKFQKAGDQLALQSFTWDADHNIMTTTERAPGGRGSKIELGSSLPAYPILRENSEQILDRDNNVWLFPWSDTFVLRHPAGEALSEIVGNATPQNSELYHIDAQGSSPLVDREGSIWIAEEQGVHRLSYSPLVAQELPKGPGPWFSVAPDDGGVVWILAGDGEEASTIYRVADRKWTATFQRKKGGISNFAYRAPDKTFWFGGEGGLWHMVNGQLSPIELPHELAERTNDLTTITQEPSGAMWVSFGRAGLYRLKDGVWEKYGGRRDLPSSGVLIEFTDSLGRVWFGCPKNQLVLLDGDRVQTFGSGDGLQIGNITAIYGKGTEIWIGGDFGLQLFDHGRFHTIRSVDKELLRGISGIVETANGDLWLNGLGGIIHVSRPEIVEALENPAHELNSERFDRRAGLPGLATFLRRMPSAIEGTDGRLWFPVINGVVWLDPTRASKKIPSPPVSIQSVSADGKDYGLDLPLRFPAHTSNVQISFAAVSLMNPEAIRFRYKVTELDNDWHDVGRSNLVSYRNLHPGTYHFQVGSSATNGLWSEKAASAEFTIAPAFYQTNWFRAVCALAFLALLWAVYQFRIRQLRRQFEMTLDARVSERTRIARDLHDTLLQSFHGLLLRFQTVSQLLPERPVEAKEKLDGTIEQAAEAITEGRDAVQGLRDSTVQTNNLALAISTLGEELAADAAGQRPEFRVAVEGQSRNLHPILRDEVYKIAAEALRNAFNHAHAKQIEVEIRYDDPQFRMRVRDDGKGIDPAVLAGLGSEGHYGLPGMRERAKIMGAKLTVWSEVDAGTEVELRLPASIAYTTGQKSSWWSRAFTAKAKG